MFNAKTGFKVAVKHCAGYAPYIPLPPEQAAHLSELLHARGIEHTLDRGLWGEIGEEKIIYVIGMDDVGRLQDMIDAVP